MNVPAFYKKKPLFGLDVGTKSIKVVQLEKQGSGTFAVTAYGYAQHKDRIAKNGVIQNVELVAALIDHLLSRGVVGRITTNRVAMSLPISAAYARVLNLPNMSKAELHDAVMLEVEQSVPVPVDKLYVDYEVNEIKGGEEFVVQMVATPREIVDSYMQLCEILKLEPTLIQTNIQADAQVNQLFEEDSKSPYILVDMGSNSIDVSVVDTTSRVSGTVEGGGDDITAMLAKSLNLSHDDAHSIKIREGLSPGIHQKQIMGALAPMLQKLISEIQRLNRFYKERINPEATISQIRMVGGGGSMPGLAEYISTETGLLALLTAPWSEKISFAGIDPPSQSDAQIYLTAIGLALNDSEGEKQ